MKLLKELNVVVCSLNIFKKKRYRKRNIAQTYQRILKN